jgi:hypothetical protein
MYTGEFLEDFFSKRGPFELNVKGEASVLCPFPHDHGYERRPSAHVNPRKGIFHCKTCSAEGRFSDGGLSETSFVSEYYGIGYGQAIQLFSLLENAKTLYEAKWSEAHNLLLQNTALLQYLLNRGITLETVKEYMLGFTGDGICYPVTVFDQLSDVRTYDPDGKPKMRSQKGAKPLLYPFDHWIDDERATLLVAGENDCLLARQLGFNALTVTGGEGVFPDILQGIFKDRIVYVCYDCDEAGKKGSRSVAFKMKEAGATVYLVDLGLPGTKDDKDMTDFVVKHGFGYDDVAEKLKIAVPYDGELYLADKNAHYPLVDLWDVPSGRHSGKMISSRVVLSGTYDQVMQIPSAIQWTCRGAIMDDEKKSPCHKCPLNSGNKEEKSGWWLLEDKNLKDVMYLAEVNEDAQKKNINKLIRMPEKCPNGYKTTRTVEPVYKVIFTPDVETEALDDFRATEQYAYTVGLNLDEGARYRAFFRAFPHPNDGQRVFMVVSRVEDSDNAINTFKMNPEIQQALSVFQGDPTRMMALRAEMAKDIVGPFARDMVVYGCDLMYHSPLRFKYNGKPQKGYPEGLIAGDTRTGKSAVGEELVHFYRLGNFSSVKRATTAGLLGGAEKLPNGGFKVTWGIIPRNNRGLVFLDEMSDCSMDVIASLTDMRSSGRATVSKIAKGKAPANTRMLWMSNPRKSADGHNAAVEDYPTGVSIVHDLVGATEDIARFDFIMLVPEGEIISPLTEVGIKAHDSKLYRDLIYWVWSRNEDQVTWQEGVEAYVWQVSQELNEKYNTDVKLFGAEAWKKLARIAVACAAACFSSSEDGECIVIGKSHVDWACNFLVSCYDNSVFRLAEYVRDKKVYNETNDAVNVVVAGMCRSNPMVIKSLLNSTSPFPKFNLQAISGLGNDEFNSLMGALSSNYLITASVQGFMSTKRLRKAVDAYKADYARSKMIPLSQKGGTPV